MRILVGFKVTPDFEALREADWAAGVGPVGTTVGVETRYVPRVLNCFDESALETALRLFDAAVAEGPARGGLALRNPGAEAGEATPARDPAVSLAALSVGGREVEPHLHTLLALGYERAARVRAGADLDFAPALVAALIAGYVQQVDHSDMVLLGCRSGPGDSGTVPFLVAEELGWPCFTRVLGVETAGADRVRVVGESDDGLLRATVRLPCVLAVGNAVVSRLRVPTLSARLARREAHIEDIDAADLGVDVTAGLERRACVLTGLEAIDRRRQGTVVGGETSGEKAQTLFERFLRERIERL